jgi:hypothetical protein
MVQSKVVTSKTTFLTSGVDPMHTEAARRSIAGTDAAMAVAFLNLKKKSRAVQRVLELLQKLEELQAWADASRGDKRRSRKSGNDTQRKPLPVAPYELLPDVNRRLAAYGFVPALKPTSWQPLSCAYYALPKSTRGPFGEVSDGSRTVKVYECHAANALARLFARSELQTVHLCDGCGAIWHVAPRSIDRFCSKECREKWYTKSPKFLEKRREIQQRYRENLKRRDRAQKLHLAKR